MALAGLVGRSESWLSQVERGLKDIDSHSTLINLTRVLGIDIDELVGDETQRSRSSRHAVGDIERAMMRYDALEATIDRREGQPSDLENLRHAVARVNTLYQATRYDGGRTDPAAADPGR